VISRHPVPWPFTAEDFPGQALQQQITTTTNLGSIKVKDTYSQFVH
jgi:hypothetical protein